MSIDATMTATAAPAHRDPASSAKTPHTDSDAVDRSEGVDRLRTRMSPCLMTQADPSEIWPGTRCVIPVCHRG